MYPSSSLGIVKGTILEGELELRGQPHILKANGLGGQLGLLNLKEIYIYQVQIFVYKFHLKKIPDIFNSFSVYNNLVHTHNTRQHNNFHMPIITSAQRSRTIWKQGVVIGNHFDKHIKYNCSYATYKKHVKAYIVGNDILFLLAKREWYFSSYNIVT